MGLDMYLEAKRYIGNFNEEDKVLNKKVKELFPEIAKAGQTGNLEYAEVSFEVGYWRKANQIHQWFVANCQDGKDDCRKAYVSRDNLKELLNICKEILSKSKLKKAMVTNGYSFKDGKEIPNMEEGKVIMNPKVAQELLPTQKGFFFGSTDYNEWYLDDIKNTVTIIERCLKLPKGYDFSYHSSW